MKQYPSPPRSEIICPGQMFDIPESSQTPLLIEPCAKFQDSGKALLARSLVSSTERVAVRLMNTSSQPQTIFKNTVVGVTSPVTEIIVPKREGSVKHVMPGENKEKLPQHIMELFDRTKAGLTEEQMTKVQTIFIRFSHIFSKSKDDYGRTSLIKHHINTERQKPTKQPPRRLPHHAAEFVDQEVENMIAKGIIEPSSSP